MQVHLFRRAVEWTYFKFNAGHICQFRQVTSDTRGSFGVMVTAMLDPESKCSNITHLFFFSFEITSQLPQQWMPVLILRHFITTVDVLVKRSFLKTQKSVTRDTSFVQNSFNFQSRISYCAELYNLRDLQKEKKRSNIEQKNTKQYTYYIKLLRVVQETFFRKNQLAYSSRYVK